MADANASKATPMRAHVYLASDVMPEANDDQKEQSHVRNLCDAARAKAVEVSKGGKYTPIDRPLALDDFIGFVVEFPGSHAMDNGVRLALALPVAMPAQELNTLLRKCLGALAFWVDLEDARFGKNPFEPAFTADDLNKTIGELLNHADTLYVCQTKRKGRDWRQLYTHRFDEAVNALFVSYFADEPPAPWTCSCKSCPKAKPKPAAEAAAAAKDKQ
jgi:hypothetical protein